MIQQSRQNNEVMRRYKLFLYKREMDDTKGMLKPNSYVQKSHNTVKKTTKDMQQSRPDNTG